MESQFNADKQPNQHAKQVDFDLNESDEEVGGIEADYEDDETFYSEKMRYKKGTSENLEYYSFNSGTLLFLDRKA